MSSLIFSWPRVSPHITHSSCVLSPYPSIPPRRSLAKAKSTYALIHHTYVMFRDLILYERTIQLFIVYSVLVLIYILFLFILFYVCIRIV